MSARIVAMAPSNSRAASGISSLLAIPWVSALCLGHVSLAGEAGAERSAAPCV